MRRIGAAPLTIPTPPLDDDWRRQAACREEHPDLFFADPTTDELAKAVCRGCPVLATCRDWALNNRIEHGVWGGLDERERRNLLRKRSAIKQRGSGRQKAPCGTRAAYDRHRKNGEPIDEACATQGRYSRPLAGADAA